MLVADVPDTGAAACIRQGHGCALRGRAGFEQAERQMLVGLANTSG